MCLTSNDACNHGVEGETDDASVRGIRASGPWTVKMPPLIWSGVPGGILASLYTAPVSSRATMRRPPVSPAPLTKMPLPNTGAPMRPADTPVRCAVITTLSSACMFQSVKAP